MIDVLYIYRVPTNGFSIEELFGNISQNLPHDICPQSITLKPSLGFFISILNLYKIKASIFHLTGGQNYVGLFFPHKKVILNLHDLNYFESQLKGLKRFVYWFFWILLPVIFYKKIITGSDFSKNQICKFVPKLFFNKIIVINNCVHSDFSNYPKKSKPKIPIILHIGVDPNKNLLRVIEALEGLNVRLHVVGVVPLEAINLAKKHSIKMTHNSKLSRSQIVQQYIDSDIVSFPSTAEGFGMPILEAQAIGRPVLTSSLSPMRDIAGREACLVDPLSISSIRSGFIHLLANLDYYNSVVRAGFNNVSQYTALFTSMQYRNLYLCL